MRINDHRQTLIANNMANAETVGFKHDLAVVRERRVESRENPEGAAFAHPVLDGLPGGVNVLPVFHAFDQGPLRNTGRPLDIAIEGDGFFPVSDGKETRYTRDGRFALSNSGDLILAAGNGRWRVLDDGGEVINIDPTAGAVELADDGTVRQGQTVIARLGLYSNNNKQTLRKVGQNTFRATAEMTPVAGQFKSGAVEGSSFDVMKGLAAMIETQRSFQLNATMIRMQDELTGRAINTVGRVA